MLKAVLFACWLVVVVASPRDTIIKVDQEHHKHDQKGIPGKSVTGSYQFVAADGAIHVITYVADERGYRVIGDAKLEDTRPSTQSPIVPQASNPSGYYYPPPSTDYLPPTGNSGNFFSVFAN